jgi:hypothetical protein
MELLKTTKLAAFALPFLLAGLTATAQQPATRPQASPSPAASPTPAPSPHHKRRATSKAVPHVYGRVVSVDEAGSSVTFRNSKGETLTWKAEGKAATSLKTLKAGQHVRISYRTDKQGKPAAATAIALSHPRKAHHKAAPSPAPKASPSPAPEASPSPKASPGPKSVS